MIPIGTSPVINDTDWLLIKLTVGGAFLVLVLAILAIGYMLGSM